MRKQELQCTLREVMDQPGPSGLATSRGESANFSSSDADSEHTDIEMPTKRKSASKRKLGMKMMSASKHRDTSSSSANAVSQLTQVIMKSLMKRSSRLKEIQKDFG